LKKLIRYKNSWFLFILLIIFPFVHSCSPARRLPTNEYLYYHEKIKVEQNKIDPLEIKKYSKISTNKQIFGFRFHLAVYNLARPGHNGFFSKNYRKIGEPPVKFDSSLVLQNVRNFSKYLSDIGYTEAKVSDSIYINKKRCGFVTYTVSLGTPTIINTINYNFEDTSIVKYVYADTISSLIHKNDLLNKQLMQAERLRIELAMKDNGYYKFSKEYVYYLVSPTRDPHRMNLTINFKQSLTGIPDPITHIRQHRQYKIDKVYLIPLPQSRDSAISKPDTLVYEGQYLLYYGEMPIRPVTLASVNRIYPGALYNTRSIDRTYTNLTSLGLFRYINISYNETSPIENYNRLNCYIEMAMRKRQSYSLEGMLTNSNWKLGISGSINYNNYNLFKGGELLKIELLGALQQRHEVGRTKELGVQTRFETPKFLFPFIGQEFQRKFSPRTAFEFSYNFQKNSAYTKTVANLSYGYNWRGNSYNKHSIYPIDFYLVKLPQGVDSAYFVKNVLDKPYMYSYINHSILGIRYVFEFTNQSKGYNSSFIYLKSNIESAGLTVNIIDRATKWGSDSNLFGVKYFQYIRGDIDFRHFNVINPSTRIVYRLYAGIGMPYGNSGAMPTEKMFWSGGPYGIRSWKEGYLGPGSYSDTIETDRNYGDIKLEANLEYRFKLVWKTEGALFVEGGNIWEMAEDKVHEGATFHFNKFYNDIAIGAGFGLRLDLSFVLLRTDFGFKIKDPALPIGERWTFLNHNGTFKELTIQFGIGYPF
jgi:outer membrane protein assembly factor BamA